MQHIKRITANIPYDLLEEATKVTGKGTTDTLILGLQLIKRSRALEKAQKLKGKVELDVDLEVSRERTRR